MAELEDFCVILHFRAYLASLWKNDNLGCFTRTNLYTWLFTDKFQTHWNYFKVEEYVQKVEIRRLAMVKLRTGY